MIDLADLKDELLAVPVYEWELVPITVNRHKWWLRWYRGDDGEFYFAFISPKKRCYVFFAERGKDGHGRVTDASVADARGYSIANYMEVRGDKPERLDDVIRLTPRHIIDRLIMLLDAIG